MDERNGTPVFLLPCGNLCGAVCEIYEARPTTCRTYKCTTLTGLKGGEIDRAEADRRVAIGRATVARVRERLLPGESFLELRTRFGRDPSPAPDFKLAMLQWDIVMDRFFRKPHQRVLTPEPEAQEPIASPADSPEPCTVSTTRRAGGAWRPESRRSRSTPVSRRA